jgi:hypothetical protein
MMGENEVYFKFVKKYSDRVLRRVLQGTRTFTMYAYKKRALDRVLYFIQKWAEVRDWSFLRVLQGTVCKNNTKLRLIMNDLNSLFKVVTLQS